MRSIDLLSFQIQNDEYKKKRFSKFFYQDVVSHIYVGKTNCHLFRFEIKKSLEPDLNQRPMDL